jgi:signal transduction histidine kinase
MLFESARELMTNALKYAGPCEIRTVVNGNNDELVVCVADNGTGFDPAAAERLPGSGSGFGLFNIRQRVEGLGGCLEIESAPGKGTRATIRVPVSNG